MKIYNEITSIFNEQTGQWETIQEDSFDYNGPMALMAEGGTSLQSNASEILDDDIIILLELAINIKLEKSVVF